MTPFGDQSAASAVPEPSHPAEPRVDGEWRGYTIQMQVWASVEQHETAGEWLDQAFTHGMLMGPGAPRALYIDDVAVQADAR